MKTKLRFEVLKLCQRQIVFNLDLLIGPPWFMDHAWAMTLAVNSHTKHTSLKLVYAKPVCDLMPQTGCRTFTTHRLTVPSGSRLASGGSNRSSLLQLTLLPTAWTPCALDRSSLQLQALKEASNAGQGWESFDSVAHNSRKSSVSTRRSDSK